MRHLSVILVSLLLLGQGETVQVFVPPGDYGDYGYLVRQCLIDHDEDDWGPREDVIVHVEWYIGDVEVDVFEYACAQNMRAAIIYRDLPRADLDMDGDVDLADFAAFQREFE